MNLNGTPRNLRPPWPKGGPSPNPNGRRKRLPISDTYALLAAEPIPESLRKAMERKGVDLKPGATFADALGLQMWMKALSGDAKAAREIRESIEGKAAPRSADPGDQGSVKLFVEYEKGKALNPALETDLVPDPDNSPQ